MIKNKILMGLGTISAAAIPALAVVACGSDDKAEAKETKPTQGNGAEHSLAGKTSFVGDEFYSTAKQPKLVEFLKAVESTPSTYNPDRDSFAEYEVKVNLTKADYEKAYKDAFTNDADMQAKFAEILTVNNDDPVLASYIIRFTYSTIKGMKMAAFGLNDPESSTSHPIATTVLTTPDISDLSSTTLSDVQKAMIVKMIGQISKGSLDAKTIADGNMSKFRAEDPIWSPTTLAATYTVDGNTLVEMNKNLIITLGGVNCVEAIVTAAGYGYRVNTPA